MAADLPPLSIDQKAHADQPTVPPTLAQAAPPVAPLPEADLLNLPTLAVPSTLGALAPTAAPPGYEILGELGRGGMGVVYKARQTALNRVVALKMILAGGHAGAELRQRFLAEAQAVARLRHPNIVQVHDLGEYGGNPFFALEFVAGGSLDKKLAGTPLPPKEAAALVATLAIAMQHAHEQGIVHRDLKPANVLVEECGTPKVMDFGLAKRLDADSGQTRSGAIMGTPSYMAPEQARGDVHAIGPAADVYALGAILYECLTGRPPFKAATAYDTVLQVIEEDPVPPTAVQAKTPRDLETICLKCLAKEPAQRYVSAQALADDLRRYLAGEPITARPASVLERSGKWVRRNRAVTAAAAGITAALLLGLGLALWQAERAQAEADRATQEAWRADGEAERANREAVRAGTAAANAQHQARMAQAEAQRAQTAEQTVVERAKALATEKVRAERQLSRAEGLLYTARLAEVERLWGEGLPQDAFDRLEECNWALRGWEFNRIWTQMNHQGLPLRARGVGLAHFTQNGDRLITDKGGASWVWDTSTGRLPAEFNGQPGEFQSVEFSLDGSKVAAIRRNGDLQLWDTTTGAFLPRRLQGPEGKGGRLLFSSGGNRLARIGDKGRGVKVWDMHNGRLAVDLPGLSGDNLDFCPDGTRFFTIDKDGTLRIWNLDTRNILGVIVKQTEGLSRVHFSPDGRFLVMASADRRAELWEARSNKVLARFSGWPIKFSPDSSCIAVSDSDSMNIHLWDTHSGKMFATLQGHKFAVNHIEYSPDGIRLVTTSESARIWDARTGVLLGELKANGVSAVAFSPDATRLATYSEGDSITRLWDIETSALLAEFRKYTGKEYRGKGIPEAVVKFSPDGNRLVTATEDDSTVWLWDARIPRGTVGIKGHSNAVAAMTISLDGNRLATIGHDKKALIWNAYTGTPMVEIPTIADEVKAMTFNRDGTQLALASRNGNVSWWSATTGANVTHFKCQRELWGDPPMAFSRNGAYMATGGRRGDAHLWDARTGAMLAEMNGHNGYVSAIALSPNGNRVATVSYGTVRLWAVPTGNHLVTFDITGSTASPIISAMMFSPDGSHLVIRGGAGTAWLWDGKTSKQLSKLQGLTYDKEQTIAFSPDGNRLAAASREVIQLWDTHGCALIAELKGHVAMVLAVCFSPDGTRIATVGHDKTTRLWDGRTGAPIAELRGHLDRIEAVTFSPDGTRLTTASADGKVRVWEAHLRPGAFLLKCPKDPALPENIDLPRDPLNAIAFSPDGARLLAQNTAGKLYAWDRATGYPLDETEPLPADATAEATTPDGKYRLFVLGGQAYYAETARWQQHLKDEAARWQEQSRPRPDWHRDQAAKAEQAGQWFAAAFHRRQLARLSADAGDGIAALEQAKLADAFRIKHEVTAARTAKKPAAPKP